jgi:hypothetical protein
MTDAAFDLLQAQRAVFRSNLRALEKLVALALLDHWSRAGETFPSVQRLSAWTSLDRTAVMRALAGLERRGAVVVTKRNGAANRYQLGQLLLLPVAESDQLPSATGRSERPQPVAESDSTSRGERHEGTQKGTQKEPSVRRASKWTRVPSTFQPNDDERELAKTLRVNFEIELAKFRDHEFAKPKVDPHAAFRNWLRTAGRFGNGRNGAPVVQRGGTIRTGDASWLEGGQ